MQKIVEFCQLVARGISSTTFNIPRIRDGDKWRNIDNAYLVANPNYVNCYDKFEGAIQQTKLIMEQYGWNTELSDEKVQCHEHLIYQHYRLRCWK